MARKIALILSSVLLAGIITSGCARSKDDNFSSEISFSGSSTLAPVITALADEFAGEYKTWNKVDPEFPDEEISIYVSGGGSGAGVKAAVEGASDFGMLAREVKDTEKDSLGEMKEITLGIDALTVSINPDNPLNEFIDDLTSAEIEKIFSGEYKYWDQVDSRLENNEIVVVIRDLGGGAHGVFQKNIMGETEVRKDAIQAPSMGALVTKIIENKNAIGYASFGMVNQNQGKLTPLKVDGVEASAENIINGSYIISRPLIVVKKDELSKEQQRFLDMVLSDKGKAIIEEMGFLPIR